MKTLILSALIFLGPVGAAIAACEDNLAFLEPDEARRVCGLEAGLPFKVGERSIGNEFIYFLAKKVTFKGDVKLKEGQAFEANGKPYASEVKAQSVAERIAKLQSCKVSEVEFLPGESLSFVLAC